MVALKLALVAALAAAAVAEDLGVIALQQALLDATTDRRVLCVAAHPDDEDLATLAYLRHELGVRTRTVFGTRGEGGQNEIGSELYDELGVIRTAECARAAAIIGTELAFMNLPDFGYAKTAEETFERWGRDLIEREVARAILTFRPHVVITHHDETTGHGHHQVLGRALVAVWPRLGTAGAFPELAAEGLAPWQPEALLLRVFAADAPAEITVPVGSLDPLRGVTHAELARLALKEHESQGRWEQPFERQAAPIRYRRWQAIPEFGPSLLGGREPPWVPADTVIEYIANDVRLCRTLTDRTLIATYLGRALATAVGLRVFARPTDPVVASSEEMVIDIDYVMAGKVPIADLRFAVEWREPGAFESAPAVAPVPPGERLGQGAEGGVRITCRPLEPRPTLPAALHLRDRRDIAPYAEVVATFRVAELDTAVSLRVPVAVEVAAGVDVRVPTTPTLVTRGGFATTQVDIVVERHGETEGTVTVRRPGREEQEISWHAYGNGGQATVLVVDEVAASDQAGDVEIEIETSWNFRGEAGSASSGRQVATHVVRTLAAQVAEPPQVAVIATYDDTLVEALEVFGIEPTLLDPPAVRGAWLGRYDVIFLDLRAYLVRPDVVEANQRLLDYVHDGGAVVVLYNKAPEWNAGPLDEPGTGFGPFTLVLGNDRVVDERAGAVILDPTHRLLNLPNKITATDFDEWVHERGLYFPKDPAPEYAQLVAFSDIGENPLRGGILHARHGAGNYVYTCLSWYRQWRAGNPGAYAFLGNLLSLGANE